MASEFDSILTEFDRNLSDPEEYLEFRSSTSGLKLIKQLYDSFSSITRSNGEAFGPLETLSIDGLDEESVWQELVLHNEPLIAHVEKLCKKLRECERSCQLVHASTDDSVGGADNRSAVSDAEAEICMEVDQDEDMSEEEEDVTNTVKRRKTRPSKVDDQFFKLSDMEEFLRLEDEREEKLRNSGKAMDEEEEIDLFVDMDSPSESGGEESDIEWDAVIQASSKAVGKGIVTAKTTPHKRSRELKYKDFFDPPSDGEAASGTDQSEGGSDSKRSVNDDDGNEGIRTDSEADDLYEDDNEYSGQYKHESSVVLSTHEKQQQKLRQQIDQLEENNMAKKRWQLKGEIAAGQRTENSLLAEDLAFDQTARPPPVFTEETTETLEDIIKRRINDEAWDDVERKEKPIEQPYEYRKRPVLDQEKSKLSLSEVYEKEYVKQFEEKKSEEERPEHVEIRKLARKLFTKLDALSHFHFTPKPPKEDINIVTNTPAITVEEIIPAAVADASLLAPEEIYSKPKGNPVAKNERTDTERKHERRLKKQQQRSRAREREQQKKLVSKLKPGLGNKYSHEKALRDLEKASKRTDKITLIDNRDRKDKSAFRSSSAFFERLQEQVSAEIRGVSNDKKQRKQQGKKSSTKLKL